MNTEPITPTRNNSLNPDLSAERERFPFLANYPELHGEIDDMVDEVLNLIKTHGVNNASLPEKIGGAPDAFAEYLFANLLIERLKAHYHID